MGKKLDAMLCRHFKTSKFKVLVNLSISRLSVLENQRLARCSFFRSDVVKFLHLGHHDRAFLRIEQVMKEQDMLDVFVMIEGYCHLLVERINLIEQERVCPEDLKEAVSGLLFAASRCGEFPELQQMRSIFTSRFGKEFAAQAIELRNNCGVNPKMVQKLSTRHPSLENRLKVLREIAFENNIVLQIEEASSVVTEEKHEREQKQNQPKLSEISGWSSLGVKLDGEIENIEVLSDSMKAPRKYKDVADAAEAAFKSAAYAAAAARAAVELSKSESHDLDDDQNVINNHESIESKFQTPEENNLRRRIENQNVAIGFENVHPQIQTESEDEIHGGKNDEKFEKRSIGSLNSDSRLPVNGNTFDQSDDETTGFDTNPSSIQNEDLFEEDRKKTLPLSQKKFPLRSEAGLKADSGPGNLKAHSVERFGIKNADRVNTENKPVSVRTRRTQGR